MPKFNFSRSHMFEKYGYENSQVIHIKKVMHIKKVANLKGFLMVFMETRYSDSNKL